jgi:hypothetical protein
MMSQLEQRLVLLEKRLAIQDRRAAIEDILTAYSRALDWLDVDLLDRVFAPEAEIDYGFFKGSWEDFRPILIDMERSFGRRWHLSAQSDMHFDNTGAWVTSYQLALSATGAGSEADEIGGFYGYYVDRFVETMDGWRIASRKHILLTAASWMETPPKGPLAGLNLIGPTDPAPHRDYRGHTGESSRA